MPKKHNPEEIHEEPNLKPVPIPKIECPEGKKEGPFRFCRIKDNMLVVIIENKGGDMPINSTFKVEVNFRRHGSQETEVEGLKEKERTDDLEFELPEGVFDPDCEFDINIYIGEDLHRKTSGLCVRCT